MNKQEFLARLREGLSGAPQAEIEERLTFYSEMIDDRMEEGLSEEEAVSAIGAVPQIVAQAAADSPLTNTPKEKSRPKRRLSPGVIVLLAIGSPVWFSLGIAAAAIVLSLYVSLWAVIGSLWSVFGSVAACSVAGVLACAVFVLEGHRASGFAMLGAGILCAGLSIFLFCGCKAVTEGTVILTKKAVRWIRDRFARKEEA